MVSAHDSFPPHYIHNIQQCNLVKALLYTIAQKCTHKKITHLIFCFIFASFLFTPFFSYAFDPQENTLASKNIEIDTNDVTAVELVPVELIKVGYTKNYGLLKSPNVVDLEGYGFEYFRQVLKYTQKHYIFEYIEVNWDEGIEMLAQGELDIMPFANYLDERNSRFLYSKNTIAQEAPVILTLRNNHHMSADYAELQGATICIHQHRANISYLYQFLEEHNINATVVHEVADDITDIAAQNKYDYILSTSLQMEENLEYLISLPSHPVYILANKNKQALLDDLDNAIEFLSHRDHLFEERLYLKYFDHFIERQEFVSAEEKNLLQNQVYNVGITNMESPISFYNTDGELIGIFKDVIHMLEKLSGFQVVFHEIPQHADRAVLQYLDFSLLPYHADVFKDLPTSDYFAKSPFVLIETREVTGVKKVGTLEYFNLDEAFIQHFLPNHEFEIIEYPNPYALIDDYNAHKINTMIYTRPTYNALYDVFDTDIFYNVTELGATFSPVITYNPNFSKEKIKIINKLLTNIDPKELEDSITRSVAQMTRLDVVSPIKRYWYVIVFFVLITSIAIFLVYKTMSKQKEEQLKRAYDIDPHTGFYTFKKFLKEARKFIENNQEKDLRVITVDIDSFSYVNETFDFNTGTQVLKLLAHHIRQTLKSTAPVAHYGGDVFCIITQKLSYTYENLVKAINIEAFEQSLQPLLGKHYDVHLSIGVYDIEDKTLAISYMVDCANIARSKSKKTFATHVAIYTESMKEEYSNQNEVLSLIKRAFANKEFQLYYQPKFDIYSMQTNGAEALVRWFRGGKMIPPNSFIPIIERNGLIEQLDYYVIEEACIFLNTHKDKNIPVISINISGFTILKKEIVTKIIEITHKYNILPSQLDIEITESALVNNFEAAITQIEELRKRGFTFSMDDFGTGVSSLNRLSTIPLDTIKLDRSFIVDALENTKSSSIVQHTISLAKDINVNTVAEGIETIEQLTFLQNSACNYGQGYFYARPMPETEFLEHLRVNSNSTQ